MADKSILIIDTNKELIQKIASMLEAEGYACFSALSGEAGIEMAKKTKPSLIFVNAAISVGMRGLEICKTIHEMDELNDVPVIILTPRKVIITERDTDLYGIVDYQTCVFSADELTLKTKAFLSRSRTKEIPEEKIPPDGHQAVLIPDAGQFEHAADQDLAVQPETSELQPSDADAIDRISDRMEEKISGTSGREGEESKLDIESTEAKSAEAGLVIPSEDSFIEYKKKSSRKSIFMVSLVTILIVVTAGAILFYDDISHLSLFQKFRPENIQPPDPAEQQAVTLSPSDELQKPQPGEESPAPPVNDQPKLQPVEEKKTRVSREKQKTEAAKEGKQALAATPKLKDKPVKKTIYSVQIGVFKNEANATSLVKKFESKGYHARVYISKMKDQSTLYRVLIGKFGNEKDAKKQADTIHSQENNIPVMIYKE